MNSCTQPISRIKNILVSQQTPVDAYSPYWQLAKQYDLYIDFQPFISINSIAPNEFRKLSVNFDQYTAIIFTSKSSIDYFFNLCAQTKLAVPSDMKYFCLAEPMVHYLQKYVTIKKRKIFIGKRVMQDFITVLKKNSKERYIFPCSDMHKNDILQFLVNNQYTYNEAVIYKTTLNDISHILIQKYDIIVFFSPSDVAAFQHNFPNFEQKSTILATLGSATAQAVKNVPMRLDIEAPTPKAPSITKALEHYIVNHVSMSIM